MYLKRGRKSRTIVAKNRTIGDGDCVMRVRHVSPRALGFLRAEMLSIRQNEHSVGTLFNAELISKRRRRLVPAGGQLGRTASR